MSGFLVELPKELSRQIDNFITEWDASEDKLTYLSTIERFIKIKTSKPELYQKILNWLKITNEAIHELTVYLIDKHSKCHGQDLSAEVDRIRVMVDYVTEKFFMVCTISFFYI